MENILAEIPGPLKSMGVFTLVLCHTIVVPSPSPFSLTLISCHSPVRTTVSEFIKTLHISLLHQNPSLHQTTGNGLFPETKITNFSSQMLIDV